MNAAGQIMTAATSTTPRSDACLSLQITELSKEVFRLKEALGALTPPLGITSSSSTSHHSNPGQQVALQNRISILTQQLQVRGRQTSGKKS